MSELEAISMFVDLLDAVCNYFAGSKYRSA